MIRDNASNLHRKVYDCLREAYPSQIITQEITIRHQGKTLYVDILLPRLGVAIECDGVQHDHFNKFFHRDKQDFMGQKSRDSVKEQWANDSGYVMVRFKASEERKLTADYVRNKINQTWEGNA